MEDRNIRSKIEMIYIYRGYEIEQDDRGWFHIISGDLANNCMMYTRADEVEKAIDEHFKELDHQDKVLHGFNKEQRKKISETFIKGGKD